MDSDNLMMLWIGFGALGLLVFILLCLVLFVIIRAGVLSALRAHARETRRWAARTGAIDVIPMTGAIPRTSSTPASPPAADPPLAATHTENTTHTDAVTNAVAGPSAPVPPTTGRAKLRRK
ncbi:MAG: hypothetical protein ABWZ77_02700 [Naasia sp.]